jgi:elongation factor 1-alpha
MFIRFWGLRCIPLRPGRLFLEITLVSSVGEIRRTCVVGEMVRDPPVQCLGFTARMIIGDNAVYEPVFDCHASQVACTFAECIQRTDRGQEKKVTEAQEWIRKDNPAIVKVVLSTPLVLEMFQEYAAMGRFAVRDMKQTVAVGVVRVVEKKQIGAKKGRSTHYTNLHELTCRNVPCLG